MLRISDLKTAADEGIISSDQAKQLREFAKRQANASGEAIDFSLEQLDEPFRLLKGFRDIFIALATTIFVVGIISLAHEYFSIDWFDAKASKLHTQINVVVLIITFAQLAIAIILAEWITRVQRLPLSSLVIATAFSYWSAIAVTSLIAFVAPDGFIATLEKREFAMLFFAFGAILGLVGFYWRYRLPFALLPLAAAAAFFMFTSLELVFSDQLIKDNQRLIIGILGALVFSLAMLFDIKDRIRVTRFSECAFWLHLLAAPMLVHSLLINSGSLFSGKTVGTPDLVWILIVMVFFSLIALLIDRRALLVSGLGYLTVVIGQIISNSDVFQGKEFAFTTFILGAIVLGLGLGWTPIRRLIVTTIPFKALTERLPPVASK